MIDEANKLIDEIERTEVAIEKNETAKTALAKKKKIFKAEK